MPRIRVTARLSEATRLAPANDPGRYADKRIRTPIARQWDLRTIRRDAFAWQNGCGIPMNVDATAVPVVNERIEAEPLSRGALFGMSLYWLAVNLHWGALLVVIMPRQIAEIHPERHAQMLGRLIGIGAVVALLLPPIVGALSDKCTHRWGRRRPYMATGTAINVVGLGALFLAGYFRNLPLYLAGYLVVQFGSNVATAAYSGAIPDLVPAGQRGVASGWMAAMTQTGTILGALGSGMLVERGHSGIAVGVIAAAMALLLIATAASMRERRGSAPERTDGHAQSSGAGPNFRSRIGGLAAILRRLWIDPRKHPDFAWVWITRFLFTAGMWMVQPFLQYYLRDVVCSPRPAEDAGRIVGLALVGATCTGLLGGAISDRVGRKRVVYVANGSMALVAIGFMVVRTMPAVYLTAVLYGLAFGAYYSVDWALGCDVLPNKSDAGKDMGVWHISMVLPQSLAPELSGRLLEAGGTLMRAGSTVPHYAVVGYLYLFAVAALLLTLSALMLRNVRGVP